MFDIFHQITRSTEDKLFFKYGVLNEAGRLTDDARRAFVDLLFIGKTADEARKAMLAEVRAEAKRES